MDVRYVNPFLKASSEVIKQVLNQDIKFDRPYVKKTPFLAEELLVIIGIVGSVKGKLMLSVKKDDTTRIASAMMGGMELEYGEITKSAIGELCNMIMGNASRIMGAENIDINITSPTILEAQNLTISQKEEVVCIPGVIGEIAKIEFNLSFE